jgi:hypothetical protein
VSYSHNTQGIGLWFRWNHRLMHKYYNRMKCCLVTGPITLLHCILKHERVIFCKIYWYSTFIVFKLSLYWIRTSVWCQATKPRWKGALILTVTSLINSSHWKTTVINVRWFVVIHCLWLHFQIQDCQLYGVTCILHQIQSTLHTMLHTAHDTFSFEHTIYWRLWRGGLKSAVWLPLGL